MTKSTRNLTAKGSDSIVFNTDMVGLAGLDLRWLGPIGFASSCAVSVPRFVFFFGFRWLVLVSSKMRRVSRKTISVRSCQDQNGRDRKTHPDFLRYEVR